jgi:hypothetical protein
VDTRHTANLRSSSPFPPFTSPCKHVGLPQMGRCFDALCRANNTTSGRQCTPALRARLKHGPCMLSRRCHGLALECVAPGHFDLAIQLNSNERPRVQEGLATSHAGLSAFIAAGAGMNGRPSGRKLEHNRKKSRSFPTLPSESTSKLLSGSGVQYQVTKTLGHLWRTEYSQGLLVLSKMVGR